MYGSSATGILPLQKGTTRLGGWMDKIGIPAMQMVRREPYPKLAPEMLKISSLPFQNDRRRINVVPIIVSVLVPWLVFVTVCGSVTFYWRYSSPGICAFIVSFTAVITVFFGATTYHQYRKRAVFNEPAREPTWFGPLFVMCLLCWIFGLVIGNSNFASNMGPYYNLKSFQAYPDVQPGATSGRAVLDGGIFIFTPTASPDVSKAISFKNVDTYCVAPVTKNDDPVVAYDFWAVGKNCCTMTEKGSVQFDCVENGSLGTNGMGGLRVINDDAALPYYTLALQQAKERYKIAVNTPIFMEWVQDPMGKVARLQDRGLKCYLFWVLTVFGWQLFLVSLMSVAVSKILY